MVGGCILLLGCFQTENEKKTFIRFGVGQTFREYFKDEINKFCLILFSSWDGVFMYFQQPSYVREYTYENLHPPTQRNYKKTSVFD